MKRGSRSVKWTQRIRQYVYDTLVSGFGPLVGWGNQLSPGNGNNGRYKEVLQEITDHINDHFLPKGMKPFSVGGVHNQINWAVGRQAEIKSSAFHSLYVLNTAAAIDSGFMKSSDLSDHIWKPMR